VAVRQKRRRLSRSAEFDRVYRRGRSAATRELVLYAFPRTEEPEIAGQDGTPRLGVSVGRRVGGAVVRNRVKRLLREAFWSLAEKTEAAPDDHDYVIVARAEARALADREGTKGFERELGQLLERLAAAPAGRGGEDVV
jgi:ribonuclease P protein component